MCIMDADSQEVRLIIDPCMIEAADRDCGVLREWPLVLNLPIPCSLRMSVPSRNTRRPF